MRPRVGWRVWGRLVHGHFGDVVGLQGHSFSIDGQSIIPLRMGQNCWQPCQGSIQGHLAMGRGRRKCQQLCYVRGSQKKKPRPRVKKKGREGEDKHEKQSVGTKEARLARYLDLRDGWEAERGVKRSSVRQIRRLVVQGLTERSCDLATSCSYSSA